MLKGVGLWCKNGGQWGFCAWAISATASYRHPTMGQVKETYLSASRHRHTTTIHFCSPLTPVHAPYLYGTIKAPGRELSAVSLAPGHPQHHVSMALQCD